MEITIPTIHQVPSQVTFNARDIATEMLRWIWKCQTVLISNYSFNEMHFVGVDKIYRKFHLDRLFGH